MIIYLCMLFHEKLIITHQIWVVPLNCQAKKLMFPTHVPYYVGPKSSDKAKFDGLKPHTYPIPHFFGP